MNKEDHPSGPNPEWEEYKGQNIAIARKIDGLLLSSPDPLELTMRRFEELGVKPENVSEKDIYLLVQGNLTLGYGVTFYDVDNPRKAVYLGIARSIEYDDFLHDDMESLSKSFKFPVYMIYERNNSAVDVSSFPPYKLSVSSPYGDIQSNILGADGIVYTISNCYHFNMWGQGVKLEDIRARGKIEEVEEDLGRGKDLESLEHLLEGSIIAARNLRGELTEVDFIPLESDSRLVPLTKDDYGKINKLFVEIDAGLYRYRA